MIEEGRLGFRGSQLGQQAGGGGGTDQEAVELGNLEGQHQLFAVEDNIVWGRSVRGGEEEAVAESGRGEDEEGKRSGVESQG